MTFVHVALCGPSACALPINLQLKIKIVFKFQMLVRSLLYLLLALFLSLSPSLCCVLMINNEPDGNLLWAAAIMAIS